jgi:formate dehydrogenase subunit delta
MNVEHMVEMANQIGHFYEAYPNRAEAMASTAQHIRRFWDPRMRAEFLRHLDQGAVEGLTPFVLEAVQAHRAELTPKERTGKP